MYDQEAVRDAVLTAGQRAGELHLTCGVTDDEAAVYVAIQGHRAFFTPEETRTLLNDLIDVADVEAWLHEPGTLHAISRLRDFADVVDNTHPLDLETVKEKWAGFNERVYDFEADPLDLRDAIQDIKETHG